MEQGNQDQSHCATYSSVSGLAVHLPYLNLISSVTKTSSSSTGSARIETVIGDGTYDPFIMQVLAKDLKVVYIRFLNTHTFRGTATWKCQRRQQMLSTASQQDRQVPSEWLVKPPPSSSHEEISLRTEHNQESHYITLQLNSCFYERVKIGQSTSELCCPR